MRSYLSSYKFGKDIDQFRELLPSNPRMAFIPNAGDAYPNALSRERDHERMRQMEEFLQSHGINLVIELFDLRRYFGQPEQLAEDLSQFGTIWVKGGNVYILQKAMERAGFGEAIEELRYRDMLYAGYSAGVCILAPSLEGIHLMDNLTQDMYGQLEIDAPGLGILDYLIIPHWDSPGHPETHLAPACIDYMQQHKLPYRQLRDGDVIIYREGEL